MDSYQRKVQDMFEVRGVMIVPDGKIRLVKFSQAGKEGFSVLNPWTGKIFQHERLPLLANLMFIKVILEMARPMAARLKEVTDRIDSFREE